MVAVDGEQSGRIGLVPVRNLWLLMLYASDLFRHKGDAFIGVEECPDEIPDLVAEILLSRVEQRLKRNLSYGYHERSAIISRVRGRIDILSTESHRLLDRGKVACRYDELTIDTPRNRYVRAALEKISKIVHRDNLTHRCRAMAGSMRNLGVNGERPNRGERSVDQFARHDADDRPMVAAAHLAFNLALPTEISGSFNLLLPERDVVWIRKLYEKGIAGFYAVALSGQGWLVRAGKTFAWPVIKKSPGIDRILPSMRTDILLDHPVKCRRIVIDTKFNSILTPGWYREESLRSGYLYQIYAYLRSQEAPGDTLANGAAGMLLHPSVGEMVDEVVEMQGHELRFSTVDLAADAKQIRSRLLNLISAHYA